MYMLHRKTSGYHIEKNNERSMSLELDREVPEDDNMSSKMEEHILQHSISLQPNRDLVEDDTLSEHDFERSISSELQRDLNFFSGSETEVRWYTNCATSLHYHCSSLKENFLSIHQQLK